MAKNDRSILYWDIKKALDDLDLKGPLRTHDEERIFIILSAADDNMAPDEIQGIEFDPEAKGASRARSFQITKWIRDFFKKDAINYSQLRTIMNRVVDLYFKFEDLDMNTEVSLEHCMVNNAYYEVLEKYKVYADPGKYPFIVIYNQDLDTCMKYPLFRLVAGLPHYSLIDSNKRLPTVDHINRNVLDTSNENLRYCNVVQNGYNHCIAKVAFHGIGKGPMVPKENTVLFGIYLWGVMFDCFVTNAEGDVDKDSFIRSWEKCPVINKAGCRYNAETLDPWIGVMNHFAVTVIKWAKQGKVFDKSTTPSQFGNGTKGFLKSLCDFFAEHSKKLVVYKTVFANDFVRALTFDLIKVTEAREFAHTNFLKVPEPSFTVPVNVIDPVDILNAFEHFTNKDHLRQGLMNAFAQLNQDKFPVVTSVYSYCPEKMCIVSKFGKPFSKKPVVLTEVPNKVDYIIKTSNCFYVVE